MNISSFRVQNEFNYNWQATSTVTDDLMKYNELLGTKYCTWRPL